MTGTTDEGRPPSPLKRGEHETAETIRQPPGSASIRSSHSGSIPPEIASAHPNARFGKFVRVARLGAGGMGEVWKAWDGELNRWVALKFTKGADEEEMVRFKREAQMAGMLSHPNIAAIYEVGEAQGRPYIAMQYVEGHTLKAFTKTILKTAVLFVRDAALAVQAAHDQGIIHRDVKPENIMVTKRPRTGPGERPDEYHVYVMDFGLARPTAGGTNISLSGSIVGTPAYMPPEQADARKLDPRADVYSLGATLYVLLTDRKPFDGENVLDTLRKVQEDDPVPPRRINSKVDLDLNTIVLKCLEKDRERRYATATALAEDLTRWLDGDPVLARPASAIYRLRKKIAKRKAVFGVGVAGVLAVGLTLAVLVPNWIAEKRKAQAETEAKIRAEHFQKAMENLNRIWTEMVTFKEWTRQAFRRPGEIRQWLQKSVDEVTAFIKSHDDMPQGYFVRARGMVFLDDLAGAEADLEKATTLDAEFVPAWNLLGQVLLERSLQMKAGDIDGTPFMNRAKKAFKAGGRHVEDALGGRWGLSTTREDEVSATISAACRDFYVDGKPSGDIEARLNAAFSRSPSEEYCLHLSRLAGGNDRMGWIDKAVMIAPHYAPARFERAALYLELGDKRAAKQDLVTLLEIAPAETPVAMMAQKLIDNLRSR